MEIALVYRLIFLVPLVLGVSVSETGSRPITVWMLVLAYAAIDLSIFVKTWVLSRQSEKEYQQLSAALDNIYEHLSEKLEKLY